MTRFELEPLLANSLGQISSRLHGGALHKLSGVSLFKASIYLVFSMIVKASKAVRMYS